MPRPKGSRNPERERSPNVRAVVEVLDAMTPAELLVARHAVTDRVAQHSEYEQNVALRSYRLEVRVLAAIEEADYEKRLSTGAPLRTVDDYREYKAPDAPGVSTIYRLYDSWEEACRAAGIADDRVPQAELVRKDGRAASRGRPWSDSDIIEVLALVLERNLGFEPSWDAYELMRQGRPEWPGMVTITDKRKAGKKSKDEWFDLARQWILDAGPDRFPLSHARIARRAGTGRG